MSQSSGEPVGGRFEIGELIKSGRTGEVYRARDVQSGDAVVVKRLHPGVLDTSLVRQRAARELTQLATLSSPNVTTIFDHGFDGELLWVAMASVPGRPLDALVSELGPLPAGKAAELIALIGKGLGDAATVGVIHRDLAAKNVLVAQDGSISLINFPIPLPHPKVPGVPEYVAPEQVEGKPVDMRGNIYSVGILFYLLVTGRPPHQGSADEVHQAHRSGGIQPPSSLGVSCSAALEEVMMKALGRSPSERFMTLPQLLKALSKALEEPAPPPSSHGPSTKTTQPLGNASRGDAATGKNKQPASATTLLGMPALSGGASKTKNQPAPSQGTSTAADTPAPAAEVDAGAAAAPRPAQVAGEFAAGKPEPEPDGGKTQPMAVIPRHDPDGSQPAISGTVEDSSSQSPASTLPMAGGSAKSSGELRDSSAQASPSARAGVSPTDATAASVVIAGSEADAGPSPSGTAGETGADGAVAGHEAGSSRVPDAGSGSTADEPRAAQLPRAAVPGRKGKVAGKTGNNKVIEGSDSPQKLSARKSKKGKFRETLWFKKGELDAAAQAAAAQAAAQGVEVATDKADSLPMEDRYNDDGTLSHRDRQQHSLRTGSTEMLQALSAEELRRANVDASVTEEDLIAEMQSGRTVIIVVAVAVAVVIGLVVLMLAS